MNNFIDTGVVVGTHGLKGEVRVQPWSDSAEFLLNFDRFYLDEEGGSFLEVVSSRVQKNTVLISFSGVTAIEEAERLRGKTLYFDRNNIALPIGSHFVQDLIGCTVIDFETGESLGELSNVSKTGANDVWHISRAGKEYLIPAIPDVIKAIDTDKKSITIIPLKGIFDSDED